MKIAICDDDKTACEILTQKVFSYMNEWEEPCKIERFLSAMELLQTPCHFDLFLLDIQMPDQNGIALAKKIRENGNRSAIIFITAFVDYVFDAFEVEAFDYIRKPIDDIHLQKALHRAIRRMREIQNKRLFIKTMNWSKSIRLDEIYYCEVINRKVHIHTKNGVIEYYCKMRDIEKQLDTRFIQCHRSYLVNLDYFLEYANGQITLESGERIPVSRLRVQDFMEAMMHYMKRKGA